MARRKDEKIKVCLHIPLGLKGRRRAGRTGRWGGAYREGVRGHPLKIPESGICQAVTFFIP